MTVWHDISRVPKDRSVILGWRNSESYPDGFMTIAEWIDPHYNGPGFYGEQFDSTWGDQRYDGATHWTEAPELPA